MPIDQTVFVLLVALAFAWLAGFVSPPVRRHLANRRAWAAIAIGGIVLSAASWFIAEEGIRGTLLQRGHGWPKPYSGECLSPECPERGPGINLLYFLGNSFVYVAGLLLVWTSIAIFLALSTRKRNTYQR
jgi:hypothetical protein